MGLACERCGGGELCVGGRCVAKPAEGLSLVVVRASVPTLDPSMDGCATWDCELGYHSAPDTYVREARLVYRTITLSNTISPQWDEVVAVGLTREALLEPMVFEVFDDDGGSRIFDGDDRIARFEVQLRPEQIAPGRLVFTTPAGPPFVSLTLELR